jgi:hypothetical protein
MPDGTCWASPEKKAAAIAKGVETRRRKREEVESIRREAIGYRDGLRAEVTSLERRLTELRAQEAYSLSHPGGSNKRLLYLEEILSAARPWDAVVGVYFLVAKGELVYVGQSTSVLQRIGTHAQTKTKPFDSWAYVPCAVEDLNTMESLYIHFLRPPMNGRTRPGSEEMSAPMPLNKLLRKLRDVEEST